MAPTYTITAADVAAVSGDSALVEGVEFDWGSTPRKIKPPASVSLVNAQWIVDHCRFAEAVFVGMGRPPILTAAGKVQTGTNPVTGNPELTSITPSLQLDWVIETQKNSGVFIIEDVYNPTYTAANGTPPYINVSGVDIRYVVTRNSTIQQISSGDAGGFTATDRTTLQSANTQATTAATNTGTLESRLTETRAANLDDIPEISNDAAALARGNIEVDAAANTLTLRKPDGTALVTYNLTDENDVATIVGALQRTAQ